MHESEEAHTPTSSSMSRRFLTFFGMRCVTLSTVSGVPESSSNARHASSTITRSSFSPAACASAVCIDCHYVS